MAEKTTLQELRDLNVRRQREKAEPEPAPDDAHLLAQASTEARERVSEEASAPVREQARAGASTEGSAQALTSLPGDLAGAVRESLALRRLHGGGTKASVDMSPELSLRLKRYCLDHGNPSSRQVMLELLIAFLDREGY